VETEAAGSAGLYAYFAAISATGTTITTEGGTDSFGNQSVGLEVDGAGATATLTDGAITTYGGTTTTAVTTTNDGAIGLDAVGGGIINIDGPTTVTTGSTLAMTGASAYGLYANNGGIIQTSGTPTVDVTTYGDGAIGSTPRGRPPPHPPRHRRSRSGASPLS
jgi:hypothetical protein